MDSENFWQKIKKPFFVLAPMANVTDAAFRRVIAKYGKPDAMWTEFVAADGLVKATPEGRAKLLKDLIFDESERPIVAQLFSENPDHMEIAAKLCRELGFDGIGINMGCPDKTVEKQRSGACLIKYPELAKEIIRAAKRGAGDLPVSVKTRMGYNKVELEEWLPVLLSEDIAALTLHARTRKEMSKVPARWEFVKRAVEIRDQMRKTTLIIGNGDVKSVEEGKKRVEETGCDGIMIGRGIFGNPFVFSKEGQAKDLKTQLTALLEHIELFDRILGETKNFAFMKKHFKSYVQNFENAGNLREQLMNAEGKEEVIKILERFLNNH